LHKTSHLCKNNAFYNQFFAHFKIKLLPLHSETYFNVLSITFEKIELKNKFFNKKKFNYV